MSSLVSTGNTRMILSSANGCNFEYSNEFHHATNDSQYLQTGG